MRIRSPQLRVIDENGQQLGVMTTGEALRIAQDKGLDLIEVSPKAEPPVAKIMSFGQFQYQQSKQKKQKSKKVELKTVKISLKIGKHDLEVKAQKANKFLDDGNKVRVELFLRGRERQHYDLAKEIINNFVKEYFTDIKFEQPLKIQGGNISMIFAKN
jgi:translation initiation factor IF-3